MAHRGLTISRLRQCAAVWRIKKDRVVAETARSARLRRDCTLDGAARFEQQLTALCQRECTDKPRRGGRGHLFLAEGVIKESELLRVGGVGAAEPGRFDAGRPVERIDFEAGVFRDGELTRMGRIKQRLETGVF